MHTKISGGYTAIKRWLKGLLINMREQGIVCIQIISAE